MELTSKQRRWLRGQAHALDPLVRVGKAGLTAGVVAQTAEVLEQQELIKVRFGTDREERARQIEQLAADTAAAVVGSIGRVAILYRQHPDPESRRYQLPVG